MLKRLKNLISENLFLIFSLLITTILFYLTFINYNFLIVLFLFLLFFNFYYLRGPNVIFFSFISPLPFYFLSILSNVNHIIVIILWPIYYFLLLKNNILAISALSFFIITNIFLLFDYLNFIYIFILFFILFWIIFYLGFKNDYFSSLIKTSLLSQFLWINYFLPVSLYFNLLIMFIFFVYFSKSRI